MAASHPTRQTPRKRPELLLGALALLGAAAALIALGVRGAFVPKAAPSIGEPIMANPFDEPPPAAPPAVGQSPAAPPAVEQSPAAPPAVEQSPVAQQPETTANTQSSPAAVGYTGIVVYHTEESPPAVGQPPVAQSSGTPAQTQPAISNAPPKASAQQPAQQLPQYPVNINTATQAQLETLPGIGPAKAQAILRWRATYGRFNSVAQLIEVSGIGEKTLQNLLPYVTV